MENINRRSALAIGLGATSVLVIGKGTLAEAAAKEKMIAEGVVERSLGEGPAIIPGYGKVMLRDIVIQSGASTPPNNAMKNAMVCHITRGQVEVVQDGKTFIAKTNHV